VAELKGAQGKMRNPEGTRGAVPRRDWRGKRAGGSGDPEDRQLFI